MKVCIPYLIFSIFLITSCNNQESVNQYAPIETLPNDSILNSLTQKTAIVITAHDDDICMMSGTISKLNNSGWQIVHIYIPHQNQNRNIVHKNAAEYILDSVIQINLKGELYRKDFNSDIALYNAIPKSEISRIYNYQIVRPELVNLVTQFSPSVIFTLDNEIGIYGHPDHVFISQLVLDLALDSVINPIYIYQSVMTDYMEKSIIEERHSRRMNSWGYDGDGWKKTRETYGVNGMPDPNVQINILSESENKMKYLRSYKER